MARRYPELVRRTVYPRGDTPGIFNRKPQAISGRGLSGILSAIEANVAALAHDPSMHQNRIRIQAIGCLDLLPEPVVAAIRAAETATAQHDLMTLTIAVGYGGREEIADAGL
jgi:short-chain Z-isoprenyl diphosphate synthase